MPFRMHLPSYFNALQNRVKAVEAGLESRERMLAAVTVERRSFSHTTSRKGPLAESGSVSPREDRKPKY